MPESPSIIWPSSLGAPLRASYRGEAKIRFSAVEVEDGPQRFRLQDSDDSRIVGVSFLWTQAQLKIFEEFVHITLDQGKEWFVMEHLTGLGMVQMICHLQGDRTVTPHRDLFDRDEVAFTVEAYLSGFEVPTPFELTDIVDGGTAGEPPYESILDARFTLDTEPTDVINALSPTTG